jgi:hypothetical protein
LEHTAAINKEVLDTVIKELIDQFPTARFKSLTKKMQEQIAEL